jgi:dihydroflavonol-4-reductase
MAIFDREAKGMLALVGMYLTADNSKTRDTFNWTPTPFKQSLLDTAAAIQNIRNK